LSRPRLLAAGTHNDKLRILDTDTGQIHAPEELPQVITSGRGGYLVGTNLYGLVAECQAFWGQNQEWVSRIQSKTRKVTRGDRRAVFGTFLPIYFGFKFRKQEGRRGQLKETTRRLYYHCIDLEEIAGLKKVQLTEAVDAGFALLEMCERRGVQWTATRGGLGARLLKASPKWELGRRPAPGFINDQAREHLPGNYYGLGASIGSNYKTAIYVDQSSSHHAIASTTNVPHPHYLRARGNARQLAAGKFKPWVARDEMDAVFSQYGLVAAMISVSHIPDKIKHLYPPFMHKPGRRVEYIYTNERHYFDSDYATIEYLCAAWVAPLPDPAVREFGEWALSENKQFPNSAKKPILLSAYGTLAKRRPEPGKPLINYYSGEGKGWPSLLPIAGTMREIPWRPQNPVWQSTVTNVIARGVIEAECRARSLALAQELHTYGIRTLSIYVDGLILETDRVPFLPDGWRVSHALTNVRFLHPNSFTSDEVDKLPGVPRSTTERRYAARRPLARGHRADALKQLALLPTAAGAKARDELLPF
jgi:hypothetical protein